ncbi:MAG TPA: MFS transporter [Streptosporangiaceae bacterium]|jgi:OPA family glycerol-3-phosphate transporter-like MFS transporter
MWLLLMAILANLIAAYELQISPVLPLLLKDLGMSLGTYGLIQAVTTLTGAVSALLAGRWCDRVGRVKVLTPLLFLTGFCCLAMVLVSNATELFVLRFVLTFVESAAIAATAPLVRDFSPRMGRASSFAFWDCGPVGSSFLASGIAAVTLDLFHDSWRSQFVIMGVLSLVFSVVIAATIADLSPALRGRIMLTESRGVEPAAEPEAAPARQGSYGALLRRPVVWVNMFACYFWVTSFVTFSVYGTVILTESFGIRTAEASRLMTVMWVAELIALPVFGWISDRLQMRKAVMLVGAVLAVASTGFFAYFAGSGGSTGPLMVASATLGLGSGIGFCTWLANYSETTEDIAPAAQGRAWGLYGFIARACTITVSLGAPAVIGMGGGWQTWLVIATAMKFCFIPLLFFFKGPWRRPRAAAAPTIGQYA